MNKPKLRRFAQAFEYPPMSEQRVRDINNLSEVCATYNRTIFPYYVSKAAREAAAATILADALKEFCHQEDCEYPGQCPESHLECFKLLDMATAAAWDAQALVQISRNVISNDWRNQTWLVSELNRSVWSISAIARVADRHSGTAAKRAYPPRVDAPTQKEREQAWQRMSYLVGLLDKAMTCIENLREAVTRGVEGAITEEISLKEAKE